MPAFYEKSSIGIIIVLFPEYLKMAINSLLLFFVSVSQEAVRQHTLSSLLRYMSHLYRAVCMHLHMDTVSETKSNRPGHRRPHSQCLAPQLNRTP